MADTLFFDRDLSWLSFNERVLMEAGNADVPLMERVRFLSIYSSNLDEFYRVRMPYLLKKRETGSHTYDKAVKIIDDQQHEFGRIFGKQIIPELEKHNMDFCYKEDIPEAIVPFITNYFYTQLAGFLHPILLTENTIFFPENNHLYLVAITKTDSGEQIYLINVPSNHLNRFVKISVDGKSYIVFLEDIIRFNTGVLFPEAKSISSFNIKVTRDAEMEVKDADDDTFEDFLEQQLKKRDLGFAIRFLYEPGLPIKSVEKIVNALGLKKASLVKGGRYHNLKDLASLPIDIPGMSYPSWPPKQRLSGFNKSTSLFQAISQRDLMVHTPYQSYDTILRFFNEAAIDPVVEEIYTTMYRVASNSKIVHALISAAKTGKKVTVLVELKARFDEENNINWAKKMKSAGVKIVYTVKNIKVHAKLALVKRQSSDTPLLGLLATGNLNETTARFYTDHVLLTANQEMLAEAEKLFGFLSKKKTPEKTDTLDFRHLLVAQFNLHSRFLELIEREIENAKQGLSSGITIKLNNLEEETLIKKLYEASNAGVKVNLIVRSICRVVPGIPGQSENIIVKRIVDRFLEHGRVFLFNNNGKDEIYMGSSDWMNRNIYRRIEVCFPIYDPELKNQLHSIISLQLNDTDKAVLISRDLKNISLFKTGGIRSQQAIYEYLSSHLQIQHGTSHD
jgi:polyphosphate kinase